MELYMTTWNLRFGARPVTSRGVGGEAEGWEDGGRGFWWLWSCYRRGGGVRVKKRHVPPATYTFSDIST